MSQPERGYEDPVAVPGPKGSRYGWFVGVVALLIIALITVNTLATTPNGASGLSAGARLPPFAVPLALGTLNGDADIATRVDQGPAGRHPACTERGAQILNVCQLYDQGPVVLVLFVAGGACPNVLDELQRLAPAFPKLQVAAVAIKGDRGALRKLVRSRGWRFPIGYDHDGALANLYHVSTCPQVTFAYRGGRVADRTLLVDPASSVLRARLASLTAGARSTGSGPPA